MSNEHIADVPPGYVPFHVMDYLDTDKSIWLYFAELVEPENQRILPMLLWKYSSTTVAGYLRRKW